MCIRDRDYRSAKKYILQRLEHELSDHLYYHGVHHTKDVLKITKKLCKDEKVSKTDTTLLKTAALFHDAGFLLPTIPAITGPVCTPILTSKQFFPIFALSNCSFFINSAISRAALTTS